LAIGEIYAGSKLIFDAAFDDLFQQFARRIQKAEGAIRRWGIQGSVALSEEDQFCRLPRPRKATLGEACVRTQRSLVPGHDAALAAKDKKLSIADTVETPLRNPYWCAALLRRRDVKT